MSYEIPIVDCHECKDLKFARNLAKQMRNGYGRHNSNHSFRDPQSGAIRDNQQARVIGRIGDHALRDKWMDCQIGDAVAESNTPHFRTLAGMGALTIVKRIPIPSTIVYNPEDDFDIAIKLTCEQMVFERVCFEINDGRRFTLHYFWKRLS